jgi:hypothetical protein
MTTTTTATAHQPVVLATGDVLCLEGECLHLDDDEGVTACPFVEDVTACGACSTVTKTEYGDEWEAVVTWPCAHVA